MGPGVLVMLATLLALVLGAGGGLPTVGAEEAAPLESGESRSKEKVEVLPELVVTATKTEQDPAKVPASISIVTQKDIEKRNVQMVDGALKLLAGTYVRRGKGWGDTLHSVNLRGFPNQNQSRTLVLLDGQDISTGYTNTVNWSIIPVENVERIEVVRGPFSALYGGNAMGGVINIITRMPTKLEMQLQGGAGSYDSWSTYLSVGNRLWNKVSFQINYKYQVTGGYPTNFVTKAASGPGAAAATVWGWRPTNTTTNTPTNIIGDTGDNSFFNHIVSGKLSWDLAPGHKVNFFT
ncbi:MAG: TonB-dependent receptor plug domain-containing protein, partial [Desulfobaccales bacterium]